MLLHPFCIKLTRWSEKNRISHGGDVQDDFHDDLHDDPDLHDDLHDDDHQGVHQVTTNEDGSAGGVTPVRSQCHQIRWDQTNGRPAQPTPSFFLAQEQKLKWPSTKNLSSRGLFSFFFFKGGERADRDIDFWPGKQCFHRLLLTFPHPSKRGVGYQPVCYHLPWELTAHISFLTQKMFRYNEQWYVLTAQYFPRQFQFSKTLAIYGGRSFLTRFIYLTFVSTPLQCFQCFYMSLMFFQPDFWCLMFFLWCFDLFYWPHFIFTS